MPGKESGAEAGPKSISRTLRILHLAPLVVNSATVEEQEPQHVKMKVRRGISRKRKRESRDS